MIEQLFKTYYNPLCNYATTILNSDGEAEDVVQSLFIQLWENDKISSIENPERFLLRSTKFKCIDYLRKKKTQKETSVDNFLDFENDNSTDINEDDIEPLFLYFVSKLPPKTREIFLLSRKSGLTYKEIAEDKNISIKTVEAQMGRALKKMRTLLKDHDFFNLLLLLGL